MGAPRPRATFGEAKVDRVLTEILTSTGRDNNDDLIRSLMVTALDMDAADVDRRELKIASQALAEILHSWEVFAPYNDRAKVTVFGSARTKLGTPDYQLASDFGRAMSDQHWMTITGAGPGIMTAGIEGARLENSIGVSIVLPFEEKAAEIIEGDPKLATFRYFFTRKLAFMKETDAFALFPGGFGTMDEAFELLTLIQTGKSYPAPVVLLDNPGSSYWSGWKSFVSNELLETGMISPNDMNLFFHTHDPEEAAAHIVEFYSTYHSLRFVEGQLILRLQSELSESAIETLNDEFADILKKGRIEAVSAAEIEVRDGDVAELPRLAMNFDKHGWARLVTMIHRINQLGQQPERQALPGLVHDVDPQTPSDPFERSDF